MNNTDIEQNNSDYINNLPVDKSPPTQDEINIINSLFKKNNSQIKSLFLEFKDSILVGFIVLLFSFEIINSTIRKFIPITNSSDFFLNIVKALIVAFVYWMIKHYYLSKK